MIICDSCREVLKQEAFNELEISDRILRGYELELTLCKKCKKLAIKKIEEVLRNELKIDI